MKCLKLWKMYFRTDMWIKFFCVTSVPCTCCMLFAIVLLVWSLHTHSEHWQHFQYVALTLAAGQIELTWVQNGPVRVVKNSNILKNMLILVILGQLDFKEQIKKIGKTVLVYHQELMKKRPSLTTFCMQSVIQGLMVIYFKHSLIQ